MPRSIPTTRPRSLWIERFVWNAAAGAALAFMVIVLLYSIHWLDRLSAPSRAPVLRPVIESDGASAAEARESRASPGERIAIARGAPRQD